MGLLSAEVLRLNDSTQTTLSGINEETESRLVDLIIAYIEEAKTRKKKCDDGLSIIIILITRTRNFWEIFLDKNIWMEDWYEKKSKFNSRTNGYGIVVCVCRERRCE